VRRWRDRCELEVGAQLVLEDERRNAEHSPALDCLAVISRRYNRRRRSRPPGLTLVHGPPDPDLGFCKAADVRETSDPSLPRVSDVPRRKILPDNSVFGFTGGAQHARTVLIPHPHNISASRRPQPVRRFLPLTADLALLRVCRPFRRPPLQLEHTAMVVRTHRRFLRSCRWYSLAYVQGQHRLVDDGKH